VVMNKLNHRPRKTLNFKTPHAVFMQQAAWALGLHFGVESTPENIKQQLRNKAAEEAKQSLAPN
jgi:hypothetical protein